MHENIKFTVRLDPTIEPIRDLNLARKEREDDPSGGKQPLPPDEKAQVGDWQPVFGDSTYGTDFNIYAKFLTDATKEEISKNQEYPISQIQLYLQSYKGSTSVGFNKARVRIDATPIAPNEKDGDERYPNRIQYRLFVGLQGLTKSVESLFKAENKDFAMLDAPRPDYLERENDTDDFKVDKSSEENYVPFEPNAIKLKEGDTLYVESWFSPADPEISRIYGSESKVKNSPFVDELFMERIGEDVVVSHKGIAELEWIHGQFAYECIVSEAQLEAALQNESKGINTYKSPRGRTGDDDPCEESYSRFHLA